MGLILGLLVSLIGAPLLIWLGPQVWLLCMLVPLAIGGLIPCVLFGHRGFGNRGNTDVGLYLMIVGLVAALLVPSLRGAVAEPDAASTGPEAAARPSGGPDSGP